MTHWQQRWVIAAGGMAMLAAHACAPASADPVPSTPSPPQPLALPVCPALHMCTYFLYTPPPPAEHDVPHVPVTGIPSWGGPLLNGLSEVPGPAGPAGPAGAPAAPPSTYTGEPPANLVAIGGLPPSAYDSDPEYKVDRLDSTHYVLETGS
jgi:hypothetical protein